MLEFQPGILLLIGIALALITIVLVAVGYTMARIIPAGRRGDAGFDGDENDSTPLFEENVTREFEEFQRRRERAEVINYLAAGVGHDFNNIAFAISGRVQMLKQTVTDPSIVKSLDEILQSLEEPSGILGALQVLHEQRPNEPAHIRIGPELRELENLMHRIAPPPVELSVEIELEDDMRARLTRNAFQQIIANLLLNARDAIGDGPGRIGIVLSEQPETEGRPGGIRMKIRDTGPGIDDDRKALVLAPFHSSREGATGAGLGLAIVNRILCDHGGRLRLEDAPEGGLEVVIDLRLAPEQIDSA